MGNGRKGAGVNAAFDDQVADRLLNSGGHIRGSATRPTP
jgi:hypothetical protein